MKIGEKIKYRRNELGMSADDLAEKMGVNRATIFRYENGDINNMYLDKLEPLAKALGVTPGYFLSDKTDDDKFLLNDTEKQIIIAYRKAEEWQKKSVLNTLGLLTEKNAESSHSRKEA